MRPRARARARVCVCVLPSLHSVSKVLLISVNFNVATSLQHERVGVAGRAKKPNDQKTGHDHAASGQCALVPRLLGGIHDQNQGLSQQQHVTQNRQEVARNGLHQACADAPFQLEHQSQEKDDVNRREDVGHALRKVRQFFLSLARARAVVALASSLPGDRSSCLEQELRVKDDPCDEKDRSGEDHQSLAFRRAAAKHVVVSLTHHQAKTLAEDPNNSGSRYGLARAYALLHD